MRAESEMYDIIIRTAESDDRVLAAYLKGSRANPNAHKDICQDFDIMYVVKETESFRTDLSWMEPFGKVILKQEQDDAFGYGERFKIQDHYDETYSWLLLFEDGNRIDIGVETLEAVQKGATGISFSFRFWIKQDVSRSCRRPRTKNFMSENQRNQDFSGAVMSFSGLYAILPREYTEMNFHLP